MKKVKVYLSKWLSAVSFLIIILSVTTILHAQNKTVVIPLFDNESTASQTQYFVVGGEAFVPGSNVDYFNTYGNGGAYINTSGSHALVAPIHLPHGAEITEFKVFFYDTSEYDMSVYLLRHYLASGGYSQNALVSSSGTAGYYSGVDNTIVEPNVDNTQYSYHVYAYSSNWSSSLRIRGAVITYTTP